MGLFEDAMRDAGYTKVEDNAGTTTAEPPVEVPVTTETNPPAAEPTKIPATGEEPQTTAAIPDVLDEAKSLNALFGDRFKTKAEIEAAIAERETIAAEREQLQRQISELKGVNPYASDYVKGLNEFVKNGGKPEVYARVQAIDPVSLKPEDALAYKYMWEHGLSRADADVLIENTYMLGADNDPEANPSVRAARIKLTIDGNDAVKYLNQYKAKELTPVIEVQVSPEQRVSKWNNLISELVNKVSAVSVPVNEKGDVVSYELPQASKQKLAEVAKGVIAYAKEFNEITPETTSALKRTLEKELYTDNISNIIAEAIKIDRHKQTQDAVIARSNPSVLNREAPPTVTETADSHDVFIAKSFNPGFKLKPQTA